ncbi:hypothetical protein [Bradyrhizobium sp. SYSU BS000235]|uniref:hypothetical protein n=1 Tax=Bradyrhizobium sp. SYSU BS000235 TaxID=3411332 RepID=UPI003C75A233
MGKSSRRSGIQLAQANYNALKTYLESHQGKSLPRYGVELNQSAIAKACGFDRKVFQTNPRCRRLLEEAEKGSRPASLSKIEVAEASRERNAKVDAERAQLESLNLRLMAENASLRRELERWRRLNDIMTLSGRLP